MYCGHCSHEQKQPHIASHRSDSQCVLILLILPGGGLHEPLCPSALWKPMAIAYRRHRVTMGNLLEEAQENNIVIPVPESAKHQQGA